MSNTARKQRIPELDIARALAVVSIIIYHTGLLFGEASYDGGMPWDIVRFLDTFHLYVLFIVSGYLTSFDAPLTGRGVLKSARGLLLPYLVSCLIIIGGGAISAGLQMGDPLLAAGNWTQAALWGAGSDHEFALVHVLRIGGIWYLPALFWAKLFIGLIAKLKPKAKTVMVVALFALSYISGLFVWLPMSIQSGLGAILYMYIGYQLYRHADLVERFRIPIVIVSAVLWGLAIAFGGNSSLSMCIYPAGIIDIAGGIGATLCILTVAKLMARFLTGPASALEAVGKNTLALFTIHIIEDNITPWTIVIDILQKTIGYKPETWIPFLCVRLLVDALLMGIFYLIPPLRMVFFPHVKRGATRPIRGFWRALGEQSAPAGSPALEAADPREAALRPRGSHFRS